MRIASALSSGQFRRRPLVVFGILVVGALAAVAPLVFICFGAMQVFNPASTHIMYRLMGFKIFFYYVSLLVIGYGLLNSEPQRRRFFTVNLFLILVIVSLGIAQSVIGPSVLSPPLQTEELWLLSGLLLNAYFGLLLGFLFRLPTVALSAQFAVNAPTPQPAHRWIR